MKRLLQKIKESRILKAFLYAAIGVCSYPGLNIINKLTIRGTKNLERLPKKNVLFVSNHQTYFADVIAFLHIFCAVSWHKKNRLGVPSYLLWPFTRVKYVAAAETMKNDWVSRLFGLAGAITVRRTWRPEGEEQRKGLDPGNTRKITRALENNWVITFPQGTTKPFAPGRKGTAFIIKQNKPVVIPVQISGFSQAFDKKGLRLKKKGTKLTITFMEPLTIDHNDSTESILLQVMEAIGQLRPNPAQTMP